MLFSECCGLKRACLYDCITEPWEEGFAETRQVSERLTGLANRGRARKRARLRVLGKETRLEGVPPQATLRV